jgi:hypothetical protein
MTSRPRLFALALLLAGAAHAAHAQGYSPAARQVIERARAASGGAGWYTLRGWRETGRAGDERYQLWIDPIRYGLRIETESEAGRLVQGFNGAGEWRILPSGAPTGAVDPATLARVRNAAFFGAALYFFPGRFDARGRFLRVAKLGDQSFDVLEITPWGGAPRELWFDRRTRLLARMVEQSGARTTTTELSDYRKIGPVLVAHRARVQEAGAAARAYERVTEALNFTVTDRALFSLPRPGSPGEAEAQIKAR